MSPSVLVPRTGRPPSIDDDGPVWQLDQRAAPTTWVAVWDALRAVPGVVSGPSALAEPGSRAVLVPSVAFPVPGTSFAPDGAPLEPAHLHSPADTSIHIVLPPERGALLIAQGWAVRCPRGVHGTELILFAPRDAAELDVVVALARESVRWSLAENDVTTYHRPLRPSTAFVLALGEAGQRPSSRSSAS